MTPTILRKALDSNRPFRIRTGDGKTVHVPTTDHAFISPNGRLLIVFYDEDGAELLDVPVITAVEFDKAPEDLRVQEKSGE
jgi:hypothetical protein